MICRYCGRTHETGGICRNVSRRTFVFLGLGVLASGALDPASLTAVHIDRPLTNISIAYHHRNRSFSPFAGKLVNVTSFGDQFVRYELFS